NATVAEGGSAARSGAANRLVEANRVAVFPHWLSGADVITRYDFIFSALLLRVEARPADRKRRPAWADRPTPQFDWRRCRPVSFNLHTANGTVALWPTKARPVGFGHDCGRSHGSCS